MFFSIWFRSFIILKRNTTPTLIKIYDTHSYTHIHIYTHTHTTYTHTHIITNTYTHTYTHIHTQHTHIHTSLPTPKILFSFEHKESSGPILKNLILSLFLFHSITIKSYPNKINVIHIQIYKKKIPDERKRKIHQFKKK